MNKTLNLINTFWEEYEDVKTRGPFLAGLNQGGFCQCSTENFIRRTKDPIEMRSFLMIGILIDQSIPINSLYEFRSVFKYPRLFAHPTGMTEQFSPSWFADNMAMRDKVDWKSVRKVCEILIFDTVSWFIEHPPSKHFYEFKRSIFDKVEREFPDIVPLRLILEKSMKVQKQVSLYDAGRIMKKSIGKPILIDKPNIDDWYVKLVEMLQQNWAIIKLGAKTQIIFVNDPGDVFDIIEVKDQETAHDKLMQNGFRKFSSPSWKRPLDEILTPPFKVVDTGERRKIYSSGEYWV